MQDRRPIIVLDFGAQYAQLIARRVRECHVYSLILPYNVPTDRIANLNPHGIILSGGPASVHETDSPQLDRSVLELGVPILGICYGLQLMAHMLGGTVAPPTGESMEGPCFGPRETAIFSPDSRTNSPCG